MLYLVIHNSKCVQVYRAVSPEEMEIAAQGVVPDNTKSNNKWAANNFAEWAKART